MIHTIQLQSFIVALIEHNFLRSALFAGLLIGLVAPIIGSFVVIRRLSFIADTLSHFSLAGLSIGLFLINIIDLTFISDPLYIALVFAVIGALIIEILRGYYQNYKEISMPIVMSMGTALSAVFINLSGGFNSSIYNYLFGSILTVKDEYLILISIVTVIVLILIIVYFKEMVILSFDETYAKLLGIKTGRFQVASTVILGVVVVLSIATVGVLLVSSLMIIPVAAAMKVGKSFKNTVGIAIFFSELSIVGGLWLSYDFSIPSGAAIVLLNITILGCVGIVKRVYLNQRIKSTRSDIQSQ